MPLLRQHAFAGHTGPDEQKTTNIKKIFQWIMNTNECWTLNIKIKCLHNNISPSHLPFTFTLALNESDTWMWMWMWTAWHVFRLVRYSFMSFFSLLHAAFVHYIKIKKVRTSELIYSIYLISCASFTVTYWPFICIHYTLYIYVTFLLISEWIRIENECCAQCLLFTMFNECVGFQAKINHFEYNVVYNCV